MKFLKTLSCCLLALQLSAQAPEPLPRKLSIGFFLGPTRCDRLATGTVSEPGTSLQQLNDFHEPKPGITAGLSVRFRLTDRQEIEAGLQFANRGFQTGWESPDPDRHLATVDGDSVVRLKSRYNLIYFELPVRFNQIFGSGNLRWLAGLAIVPGALNRNNRQVTHALASGREKIIGSGPKLPLRPFSLSTALSFGADWYIGSGVRLRLEPTFAISLFPNTQSDDPALRLWSLGVQTGAFF